MAARERRTEDTIVAGRLGGPVLDAFVDVGVRQRWRGRVGRHRGNSKSKSNQLDRFAKTIRISRLSVNVTV